MLGPSLSSPGLVHPYLHQLPRHPGHLARHASQRRSRRPLHGFFIALGTPAGYALARYAFTGANACRLIILLTRAFPVGILALPLAVSYVRLGIYDTVLGVALIHTATAPMWTPRCAPALRTISALSTSWIASATPAGTGPHDGAAPFRVADIATNAILLRAERDLLNLARRFGSAAEQSEIHCGP
ncbi:MAG: hypothetical protein JO122_02865 [Acetobacteraceae bacterium]|nr:hypothetical protein [Acetobacteraceae bacterium]